MQAHIVVSGRVQGVFFRHSAKHVAEELGLVGWIKNNPDGTVEAVAQGDKDGVEKFVKWCKKGPKFANVNNIEVDLEEDQEFNSFQII